MEVREVRSAHGHDRDIADECAPIIGRTAIGGVDRLDVEAPFVDGTQGRSSCSRQPSEADRRRSVDALPVIGRRVESNCWGHVAIDFIDGQMQETRRFDRSMASRLRRSHVVPVCVTVLAWWMGRWPQVS